MCLFGSRSLPQTLGGHTRRGEKGQGVKLPWARARFEARLCEVEKVIGDARNYGPVSSGVRRKFPSGAQVLSQSCDVTNQLQGKCRRHYHSRGSGEHAPRKILLNYT